MLCIILLLNIILRQPQAFSKIPRSDILIIALLINVDCVYRGGIMGNGLSAMRRCLVII